MDQSTSSLAICPSCQAASFDRDKAICTRCGLRGSTDEPTLNQSVLENLLYNVRVMLSELAPGQFVQLRGLFSPRVGRGDNDAISFTDDTARRTYDYLHLHVPCIWVSVVADGAVAHSLLLAPDRQGLEKGIRAAKKIARQSRSRLLIKDGADSVH
jgi:hypothetical protein